MDRLPKRIAHLYLLLGLLLSASVSWYLFHVENEKIYQEVSRDLEQYCTAIERILVQHFETVHGLASALGFFRQPDPEAFKYIARNTRQRQTAVSSLAWFWYLPDSERQALEHSLTEYYGAFSIRQFTQRPSIDNGQRLKLQTAPLQDHYLTLVAAQPDNTMDSVLGLDLFGHQTSLERPGEAIAGKTALRSASLAHAGPNSGQRSLTISSPIFRPDSSDGNADFAGMVSASLRVEPLLKRALRSELQTWSIVVSESGRHVPTRTLFNSRTSLRLAPDRFSHTRQIEIDPNRQWRVEAQATAQYIDKLRSPMPQTVFGSGLLLTAMLFYIWHNQQSRTRNIEDLVAQRTRALSAANRRLRELSHTDALTGVANRRLFNQRLHSEWLRLRRAQEDFAVIMIDVDHFKAYNDYYGHPQGDQCLSELAQCIAGTVQRPADLVSRYGGEEFVVLLPETDDKALRLAKDILLAVRKLNIPHKCSRPYGRVTISIGFSWARADQLDSPKQLIAAADRALYHAKATGRNCIAYTPAPAKQQPRLLAEAD